MWREPTHGPALGHILISQNLTPQRLSVLLTESTLGRWRHDVVLVAAQVPVVYCFRNEVQGML